MKRDPVEEDEPPANTGDVSLAHAAQSNALAFDRLYERYETPILNYCYYRLGAWPDAEDAADVQKFLTKALGEVARWN